MKTLKQIITALIFTGLSISAHAESLSEILALKEEPTGRRHIVTAWNPGELDQMCLPPCHMIWQCFVREGKYLDLLMYQRSGDMFLGVPFDISSYAILWTLLAKS